MTQAPVTPTPLPGPVDPAATVLPPAIGLIAFGIFGALWALLGLMLNLLGIGLGAADGSQEGFSLVVQGSFGIVLSIVGLLVAGLVVFAGLKMKKLETFPLVMAGTIAAMLPCISPCCVFGLPIGIWALIILLKPEVKAAFKS